MNEMFENDWAHKAALQLGDDLTDRSGLGNAWDEIDDEIRSEIITHWGGIIRKAVGSIFKVDPYCREFGCYMDHSTQVVHHDDFAELRELRKAKYLRHAKRNRSWLTCNDYLRLTTPSKNDYRIRPR